MTTYDKTISNLTIAGLVLLAAVFSGCGSSGENEQAPRPVAVRTILPQKMTLSRQLEYLGTVRSQDEVKIIARVAGTVTEMPFAEGDVVQAGEIIAMLDAPEIRAAVRKVQAEKDYWCRRYEADQRLVAARALPREQMEASRRACTSATAALAEVNSRLAKTREKATVSGRVLRWFVEPGQSVMPGQPILLLGRSDLEIQTDVIEEDLQRGIAVGTPVEVEYGAGQYFPARVSEVAPTSKGPARIYTVKIAIADSLADKLRNGASVNVNFILQESNSTLALPVSAIAGRDTRPHLFLIRADRAILQPVELGIEQDGWVEVKFPWNGSDAVAISNLSGLKDGVPVFSVASREVQL